MKVGYIGLGNMGKNMATNLLKAKVPLTVYDLRPEPVAELVALGASGAESPEAVARASEAVLTCLPKPSDVEEVVLGEKGVLSGAAQGSLIVDMSTNSPPVIQRIAAAAAQKGVEVMDAPVVGGRRGARLGTLGIMVGGSAQGFERCRPVLEAMGKHIYHVGPVGMGNMAKLSNNLVALTNCLVAMEGMVVGARAGLDVQKLYDIMHNGSGNSFMFENLFPFIVFKGRWEPPSFTIELALKDLSLVVEEAEKMGVPVPMASQALARYREALNRGLGGKDVGAAITPLEKAAGLEIRTAQPQAKG